MTPPSEFQIAFLPRRVTVGRRAATFAAARSAREPHDAQRPGARGAGGGRGCRWDERGTLHGAAERD
jgi:hypothetical protein